MNNATSFLPPIESIGAAIAVEMSDDDIRNFRAEDWREGIGNMLINDWDGADLGDVVEAVAACVEARREVFAAQDARSAGPLAFLADRAAKRGARKAAASAAEVAALPAPSAWHVEAANGLRRLALAMDVEGDAVHAWRARGAAEAYLTLHLAAEFVGAHDRAYDAARDAVPSGHLSAWRHGFNAV